MRDSSAGRGHHPTETSHPRERDTSHYAANLKYHQDQAKKKDKAEKDRTSGSKGKTKSNGGDKKEPKREGGGFKTKAEKKVTKEEQAAASREAEKKRRERMEQEKARADGIEFVGSVDSEEPDEDGYYHLDAVEGDESSFVRVCLAAASVASVVGEARVREKQRNRDGVWSDRSG